MNALFLNVHKNNKGSALVISLIILVVVLLIGGAALKMANTETHISASDVAAKQAFQAAEAASAYEASMLRNYLATSLAFTPPIATINSSISEPTLTGHTIVETSPIQAPSSPQQRNATGQFNGLTAFTQDFRIETTARANNGRASVKLVRVVQDQLIPLFQFGVFYQNLLEIFPGANMTFTGRVHSNANIRLGATATASLIVNQNMTAGGTITTYQPGTYHGETFSGPVSVTSQTQGIPQLALPIPETADPIQMIQRCTDPAQCSPSGNENYRLMSKSGLRIIDGVAYNKNNQVVDLSSCGSNNPIESDGSFYDRRESKYVSSTQINLSKLQNCSAAYNALNDPPAGGDAGILYVSNTQEGTDLDAVRITNGANLNNTTALPYGLMVATDNPLYIQGDFNTTPNPVTGHPVPVALASDAMTILSGSWNSTTDTNSKTYKDDLTKRIANNYPEGDPRRTTTVNAAILTGNVPSTDETGVNYSGGLENFPRFLENWTSKELEYGGSMVCLWQSQRATGRWAYGSPRYTAPIRDWSYNMDPLNMPPGTPRVRNLQRVQWYQAKS
ncbi:MAG: PilX N-terminal domain-containing pilus assembly protein [Thermodesulfobacteriota bacterium]